MLDTLHLPSLASGAAGVTTLTAAPFPTDTAGLVIKVVVGFVSLLPSIIALFKKKKAVTKFKNNNTLKTW